jgi:DNA-directed RNA polymerase subunit RPC12/RpoP
VTQESLWCSCGNQVINAAGRCATCDRRRRLSLEAFDGLREAALERDGYRCRNCGNADDVLVHHRRPGVNVLRWLISLCRGCHSRVHATWRPWYGFPALLLQLWREIHPELAEQRVLPWHAPSEHWEQPLLIEEARSTNQALEACGAS